MAGRSKGPWFWELRGQWVVNVRGKRHYLGTDKDTAIKKWHKLASDTPQSVSGESVIGLLDKFLEWCQKHRPASYDWYSTRICEFAKRVPTLTIEKLKPLHVQEWIDTKKSDGHKRGCLVSVHRALNWALKQGYIEKNPLRHMEKPAAGQREVFIEQSMFDRMIELSSDTQFKDLLSFCWEVGCRPQEVVRLEGRHLDLENNRCVFSETESKGKKRKRVIYLTPKAKEIVERLTNDGKLFRTRRGKGWTANNIACRFQRMEKKLGYLPCLYQLRHSYCQRALKNGVDPITLAELMGHANAGMIMKIYQHIHQDRAHLSAAAMKAVKT